MELPDYVSVQEVKRVCQELGIRDWSKLSKPEVTLDEAKIILDAISAGNIQVDIKDFQTGLEVELEHGTMYPDANVTNNHPLLTGKIVAAHLKESLDYYKQLEVMELEADLIKALLAKDIDKVVNLHKRLAKARLTLSRAISEQLA
jgi:hypothetical protein